MNAYISSQKINAIFKNSNFTPKVKTININGQKRGCSGFIVNNTTGKVCYITTEPFFDGGKGSGLWGENNKAIMMRTAKSLKDYSGGINQWLAVSEIKQTAERLTA